jgi:hypothetical protein
MRAVQRRGGRVLRDRGRRLGVLRHMTLAELLEPVRFCTGPERDAASFLAFVPGTSSTGDHTA